MSKIRTLLLVLVSFSPLWGGEQLVLVISSEMNATTGIMQRYEKYSDWQKVGEPVSVTLGRSGLGWGEGKEPLKNEGDGRSPAGIFPITKTFGYDETPNSKMEYLHSDERLICIDDPADEHYNQMAVLNPLDPPKSYEAMRRHDEVYRNGALIDYNTAGEKGRGSCIFIHLNHEDNHPTAGCTAMDEEPLKELLQWLEPKKNPRILQIPNSACERYQQEFPGIDCL